MKPFRLAEDLPADLQAAYDFYRQRSAAVADRFVSAYAETRDRLIAQPSLFRVRSHGWRQAIIPKFPRYGIFYKEMDAFWLIAGVVSTVQDPDNLLARLLIREATEDRH
ncbi:MAG TPA: type II toxin-antitoxin system RelE/ParE family toxin [Opitutaceae bacterium]